MSSIISTRLQRGGLALAILAGALALTPTARADARSPAQAFVRVDLPKRAAWVGESIPVTIRAYYRDDTGVTITGAPTLSSTDFTLDATDPAQGRADVGGTSYLVVTWKDHLSPVKAGRYALGVDLPSTLEWRSAPAAGTGPVPADPFGGDLFGDLSSGGDPFARMQQQMQQLMSQAFTAPAMGATHRKDVVLHAPPITLDVRPLPDAGRPSDFRGAVGHFTLTASADTAQARVGEPITLALAVEGNGGLDRVDLAGVTGSTDWKAYPPSAVDGSGVKTFRQPIVPRLPGRLAIPSASFSFFDPDASKYVSLATAPIPVDVAAGTSIATASDGHAPAVTSGPSLAPNAVEAGPVASFTPLYRRPWFWAAQGAPFAALGAAVLWALRRRRLSADPDRVRRREAARALPSYRAAMSAAAERGDSGAFFLAARGALQRTLGARWRLEPAAISMSDIEARLDADEVGRLRPIFDADAARFSAGRAEVGDLAGWRALVESELAQLGREEVTS